MRFSRFFAILSLSAIAPAFAQSGGFPERPVHIVVPFTAGGNVDIVARVVAQGLSEQLKQGTAPEVRTATEQGFPIVIGGWHVLAAPAGTPVEVVTRLNTALNAVTGSAQIAETLRKQGVQPASSSPRDAQSMVAAEWNSWGEIARRAGVQAD